MNQNIKTSTRRTKEPTQRQLRVGEELRHALSRVLARDELRDPALVDINPTVTEVRVSPDLRNATVFVVPLGGGGLEEAVKALNRAGGYFRSRLAREVALRHAPRITFAPDRSFDEAGRIGDILGRPRVRRDLVDREEAEPDDRGDAGGDAGGSNGA